MIPPLFVIPKLTRALNTLVYPTGRTATSVMGIGRFKHHVVSGRYRWYSKVVIRPRIQSLWGSERGPLDLVVSIVRGPSRCIADGSAGLIVEVAGSSLLKYCLVPTSDTCPLIQQPMKVLILSLWRVGQWEQFLCSCIYHPEVRVESNRAMRAVDSLSEAITWSVSASCGVHLAILLKRKGTLLHIVRWNMQVVIVFGIWVRIWFCVSR